VEYGLIVALIGATLCLGIGAAVKTVFQDTITCFMQQMQGQGTSAECAADDGGTDGGGGSGGGGGGGTVDPDASPSPTPSPTTTPTTPPDAETPVT